MGLEADLYLSEIYYLERVRMRIYKNYNLNANNMNSRSKL